jgi:hypothetical protein
MAEAMVRVPAEVIEHERQRPSPLCITQSEETRMLEEKGHHADG